MVRFLVLIAVGVCASANAQVYRCKSPENGRLTYSQTPCTDAPSVKIMNAVPSSSASRRPYSDSASSTAAAQPSPRSFDIRHTALYKACFLRVTGVDPDSRVASIGEAGADRKIQKCMEKALRKAAASPLPVPTQQNSPGIDALGGSVGESADLGGNSPASVKMKRCSGSGCWGSDNQHYSGDKGVTQRSDGKTCFHNGPFVECN